MWASRCVCARTVYGDIEGNFISDPDQTSKSLYNTKTHTTTKPKGEINSFIIGEYSEVVVYFV
jgi:hypothetical protein